MNNITLHNGDSAEVLKQYPDNHFDSIVTDPPYGIEFLGKEWDKNTGAIEVWQECLRVLKPGGHILAFSAARTYHRLATNLEDIGFEIRDQIMWIYGSGFPKGQDMGKLIEKREGKREKVLTNRYNPAQGDNSAKCEKCGKMTLQGIAWKGCPEKHTDCPVAESNRKPDNEWSGWKTGLKPAHEPIVMARKPFKGSTVDNVIKYGTGAINIDDTRIEYETDAHVLKYDGYKNGSYKSIHKNATSYSHGSTVSIDEQGRYPSNVIMSQEEGKVLDEKTGIIKSVGGKAKPKEYDATGYKMKPKYDTYDTGAYVNEPPRGASKYFYCPKVSRKERNIGCDVLPKKNQDQATTTKGSQYCKKCNKTFNGTNDHTDCGGRPYMTSNDGLEYYTKLNTVQNNHPTVKPVALMKYLVTLVTPKGGKVLDPFNGSGSTGMAVKEFGGEYVGIDLNKDYIEIANKRIKAWEKK